MFFTDEARIPGGVDKLADALSTDIDWVRKHTEFGERALRWSQAGRPGPRGLLLRSPALEEAEHSVAQLVQAPARRRRTRHWPSFRKAGELRRDDEIY